MIDRLTGESARIWQWQRRLLPYLLAAVVLLAIAFFVSTFVQFERLNAAVAVAPDPRLGQTFDGFDARAARLPPEQAVDLLRWKVTALLEADIVSHRYAQVNATLLMRAWTRSVGFVTGMILALLGALFILAKLSEAQTQLGGEAAGSKATLATSSPGIVLTVLGTALMLVTLTVDFRYGTSDVPVYLPRVAPAPAAAPPAEITEEGAPAGDGAAPPRDPGDTPPPDVTDAAR